VRVGIMLHRIEEQLKTVPHLSASGRVTLTAEAVEDIAFSPEQTIEQQVQAVARRVQDTILLGVTAPRRQLAATEVAYGNATIQ
jgi:hypothetical protein